MIELLERADPAKDLDAERSRLRDKVDERIGISAPLRPAQSRFRRPWLIAVASFAAVMRSPFPWRSAPIPRRFLPPISMASMLIRAFKRQSRWHQVVSRQWTSTATRSG